nr:MAG TPA: hypothetical protein [Caudoviricetes sp.]
MNLWTQLFYGTLTKRRKKEVLSLPQKMSTY